jgi:membrane fusion protein, adhesin transport system
MISNHCNFKKICLHVIQNSQEAGKLYKIRKQRYGAQLNSQRGQVNQRKAEISEITARLTNLREALTLSDEQVNISEDLLKDDLTNRYNHIDLLREGNRLKSSIEEDTANLTRAESAFNEEESDLAGVKHNYKEDVTGKLEESRRKLDELTQQMQKYADNLQRTTITAPVGGIVKQLYIFTKGGVVQPGETLLDIIPTGDQLIIDARLPVQDIGYIKIGQPAVVRLASADGMRFNKIDGRVTFISPDTIIPKNATHKEKAEPYYKIRLVTDKNYFEGGGQRYQLYPGVQVSVNIPTGSRTILSYILAPFISSFDNAMKER